MPPSAVFHGGLFQLFLMEIERIEREALAASSSQSGSSHDSVFSVQQARSQLLNQLPIKLMEAGKLKVQRGYSNTVPLPQAELLADLEHVAMYRALMKNAVLTPFCHSSSSSASTSSSVVSAQSELMINKAALLDLLQQRELLIRSSGLGICRWFAPPHPQQSMTALLQLHPTEDVQVCFLFD
jgi:hypothetical protein